MVIPVWDCLDESDLVQVEMPNSQSSFGSRLSLEIYHTGAGALLCASIVILK
jgi:hypothetical protein